MISMKKGLTKNLFRVISLFLIAFCFLLSFTFADYPVDYVDYFDFEDSLVSQVQWYSPNNTITHSFVDWDSWRAINIPSVWWKLMYEPFRQPWPKASMTVCRDFLADWSLDWSVRTAFTQYRNFRSVWVANNRFGAAGGYTTSFTSDSARHTACIVADNDNTSAREYRAYMDWVLQSTTTYNEVWYNTSERRIFNGIKWTYDNLFFYDRTLSDTEIAWLGGWLTTGPTCWTANLQQFRKPLSTEDNWEPLEWTYCENWSTSQILYDYTYWRTRTCSDDEDPTDQIDCSATLETDQWICWWYYNWSTISTWDFQNLTDNRPDLLCDAWTLTWTNTELYWPTSNLSWSIKWFTRECHPNEIVETTTTTSTSWSYIITDNVWYCWAWYTDDPIPPWWWWFSNIPQYPWSINVTPRNAVQTVLSQLTNFFYFWVTPSQTINIWLPTIWTDSTIWTTNIVADLSDTAIYTKTCTSSVCTYNYDSWVTVERKITPVYTFLSYFVPVVMSIAFISLQLALIFVFVLFPTKWLWWILKNFSSTFMLSIQGRPSIQSTIALMAFYWVFIPFTTIITTSYLVYYIPLHNTIKDVVWSFIDIFLTRVVYYDALSFLTITNTITALFYTLVFTYLTYVLMRNVSINV